nr:MAG TPA: hypothetical protein [Caudoviricetes sp.]
MHRDDASIAPSVTCPLDDNPLFLDFAAQCRCEELHNLVGFRDTLIFKLFEPGIDCGFNPRFS